MWRRNNDEIINIDFRSRSTIRRLPGQPGKLSSEECGKAIGLQSFQQTRSELVEVKETILCIRVLIKANVTANKLPGKSDNRLDNDGNVT